MRPPGSAYAWRGPIEVPTEIVPRFLASRSALRFGMDARIDAGRAWPN